jgi:hypothetical protein
MAVISRRMNMQLDKELDLEESYMRVLEKTLVLSLDIV